MTIVLLLILVILCFSFAKSSKTTKKENKDLREKVDRIDSIDEYAEKRKHEADKLFDETTMQTKTMMEKAQLDSDVLLNDALSKHEKISKEISTLENFKESLMKELDELDKNITIASTSIDLDADIKSDEIKNKLALLRTKQDECVKNDLAVIIKATTMKKSDLNKQLKQILRCFNAEATSIIDSITVKNIDSSRSKIQRAFSTINKIFEVDSVQLSNVYLEMKLEELSLVYSYQLKQQEEAEVRKAIREQMVEEEKVLWELDRAKQQIDKDRQQFAQEIKKLMGYMQKAQDDVERQLYIDKINDLETSVKVLDEKEQDVLTREQNARAGFVYIISNIGAFGEDVYKIGMTRRLEPMDRISELSSASVPFPFDVHALIFANDAPALESTLHEFFRENQVNKVNSRKEFFKVSLDEVKKVVLEKHNSTVQFIDEPEAAEYRETLKLLQADEVAV